ncbi:hypothetical protein ACLOJK_007576 [Asimina triloba]
MLMLGAASSPSSSSSSLSTSRRVMLVAEPTRESTTALQWALSHALLENDELILLHIELTGSWRHQFSTFLKRHPTTTTHPTGGGGGGGDAAAATATASSSSSSPCADAGGGGEHDFLEEMRGLCRGAQPKLRVHIEKVEMEGKDKASAILFQAKLFAIDLLIIGQRRHLSRIIGNKLSGHKPYKGSDTAEYLIENSKCLCVGVQKKGQNAGYLLNTKTRRNFWLLA